MSQETTTNPPPLLDDDSIIQISLAPKDSSGQVTIGSTGFEPGSALSKLLDLAIAHAAKESTPEQEGTIKRTKGKGRLRSTGNNSNSNANNASNNNNNTNNSDSGNGGRITADLVDPSECTCKEHVYSISFLLELRDSPLVENCTSKLPDKSFWVRQKAQANASSNGPGNRRNANRRERLHNQHENKSEMWEKKSNKFLGNDLDGLSNEKISQLLGENPEEMVPEWDSEVMHSSVEMNMGSTVEDFERWKSMMREEERRKNGEIIDEDQSGKDSLLAENAGNAVDSFFSFVKPKHNDEKSPITPTAQTSKIETSSKSSRFSSFFSAGPGVDNNLKPSTPQSMKAPQHGTGSSKFFSQPTGPQYQHLPVTPSTGINDIQSQPQPQQQLHQQQHKQQPQQHIQRQQQASGHPVPGNAQVPFPAGFPAPQNHPPPPPPGFHFPIGGPQPMPVPSKVDGKVGGNSGDSFFMSLLNKKEPQPNSASSSLPMQTSGGASKPTQQQEVGQDKLHKLQGQQQQHPQQYSPAQHIQPGELPPWMKHGQQGQQGHMPGFPMPPNGQQGGVNFQGPPPPGFLPPNMPYPPNMNRQGPPGMFPPGFVPPPGFSGFPQHQQQQEQQQQGNGNFPSYGYGAPPPSFAQHQQRPQQAQQPPPPQK
ncbi:uncharacterized protein KQ657_001701 [Scheffersomyces spartinae]|uniref:Uncharacterized protein n=1 Tax=Scheffersomyces spartinae TaxID=45513 RepID=A0A9P7V7E8_9ASCO|nr:uncharacterized protein KQ657_001701 [Scheffersomyces spartinae]KAG7192601.1 hypothetical protein KQ657_001701 [Scheffersomyces spartinae]